MVGYNQVTELKFNANVGFLCQQLSVLVPCHYRFSLQK